ncbi:hypothetical protein HPB51_025392 [Rhipicephalus microplus]|uniref:NADH dehydrogenase [ubiquinone] 1 beta subcomplex subunit 9 n=1 Tax=Rhipicephalus microplus TaxID=6941 RepID=A0A9J6DDP6_RHIMP|nr:hypothetical protein HPB51_025392 [Rhipicephalus microplus]
MVITWGLRLALKHLLEAMAGVGLVVTSEWTQALDWSWRAFRPDFHGFVIGEVHAERDEYRMEAVRMRQRFETYRHIKDLRIAKEILEKGEEELFQSEHPYPMHYALSPHGVAYGREQPSPDWVLDYWHPLEKAQYPEYFAKRELRKKEYVENWEKQYGKPGPDAAHH